MPCLKNDLAAWLAATPAPATVQGAAATATVQGDPSALRCCPNEMILKAGLMKGTCIMVVFLIWDTRAVQGLIGEAAACALRVHGVGVGKDGKVIIHAEGKAVG